MSAEVSVFAPVAAEGAVDTGQAPAETQTARGKRANPRGARVPGPTRHHGSLTSESHSQGVDWGASPALNIVASPSKMLRGPENCVQSGNDVSESSGVLELVCVSS